jgi:RNA polymerase sigma-70 factor (ECF subfamily)
LHVPPELIESARRNDPGAFDELVRLTHRSVYTLVFRIVGNAEDAADVTQDVYLRCWRGLRTFRGDSEVSTWLHRIAANAALTFLKRRARAGQPVDPIELPDVPVGDGAEQRADADLLEGALAALPEQQRAVVVLKDVYGWSCEEIARKMGTTEGAIKVRLFRARRRLAAHLSGGNVVPIKRKKSS